MAKMYDFTILGSGWGETPEEAWENCRHGMDLFAMDIPEYTVVDDEEDDPEDFASWTNVELFGYLVAEGSISHDDKIEDYDRIDLFRIVTGLDKN